MEGIIRNASNGTEPILGDKYVRSGGGFRKGNPACLDLSHNPPSHLSIPYGQEYVHVCPACKRKITLVNNIG